jgi:hypothetical protein
MKLAVVVEKIQSKSSAIKIGGIAAGAVFKWLTQLLLDLLGWLLGSRVWLYIFV